MKTFIAVLALAAATSAAAVGSERDASIVRQSADVGFDGSYQSSFETSNGISAQEQGNLKNAGNPDAEAEEVSGSVQYTAPDGTPIGLTYIANENGFQPQGDHLPVAPTPPPIPVPIARALEWIAAHPEPTERVPRQ